QLALLVRVFARAQYFEQAFTLVKTIDPTDVNAYAEIAAGRSQPETLCMPSGRSNTSSPLMTGRLAARSLRWRMHCVNLGKPGAPLTWSEGLMIHASGRWLCWMRFVITHRGLRTSLTH